MEKIWFMFHIWVWGRLNYLIKRLALKLTPKERLKFWNHRAAPAKLCINSLCIKLCRYHAETRKLICVANQLNGFNKMVTMTITLLFFGFSSGLPDIKKFSKKNFMSMTCFWNLYCWLRRNFSCFHCWLWTRK